MKLKPHLWSVANSYVGMKFSHADDYGLSFLPATLHLLLSRSALRISSINISPSFDFDSSTLLYGKLERLERLITTASENFHVFFLSKK